MAMTDPESTDPPGSSKSTPLNQQSKDEFGSSHCSSAVTNPTSIHEDVGLIPGLAQRVKDLALLWLWPRQVATALIRPLAWEPPYAAGAALKRQNRNKEKELQKPCFFFSLFFRAAPMAHGSSQARG